LGGLEADAKYEEIEAKAVKAIRMMRDEQGFQQIGGKKGPGLTVAQGHAPPRGGAYHPHGCQHQAPGGAVEEAAGGDRSRGGPAPHHQQHRARHAGGDEA
jgi:hypothetical protein